MAAKKTGRSAPKGKNARSSGKSGGRTAAKNNKTTIEERLVARKQVGAIILFAVALFLLCLAIIPGASVWESVRGFYFGIFGFCTYIWPAVLVYVAVMTSLDRPTDKLGTKVIEAAIFILLLCSVIHVFTVDPSGGYFADIKSAYLSGIEHRNGGAFGAILGGGLFYPFGKTAAAATLFILMFVDLMFMTGLTLIRLFRTLWKPVQKIERYSEEKIQNRERERTENPVRRKPFNVDVDLGPSLPAKDIFAQDDTAELPDISDVAAPPVKRPQREPEPVGEGKAPELKDIIQRANKPDPEKTAKPAEPIPLFEVNREAETPVADGYQLPPVSLLKPPAQTGREDHSAELNENSQRLVETLKSFGVETKIVDISQGPSVTRYELQPAVGVKISKITNLSDDIALNLAASGVRIEAPIPNKRAVGIEVPNKKRDMVTAREIIDTQEFRQAKSKLTVALGKDITGHSAFADLAKMPHLLIAGTTGSGKSVCLNSMIISILYHAKPDEVKFLMIDPKKVEFSVYNGIPHLLVPVVGEPRNAAGALNWAVTEMLERYKIFSDNNVRDIRGYNALCEKNPDKTPMYQIVIVIDELSDLMMAAPNEVEDAICRLAQMARAAGMHLLIATQRPSVDVITGIIKANIPSRIALSVSSQIDSRTILDMSGAEKLLGNGDMLFNPIGNSKPIRIQGCFLSDAEVEQVVDFIKQQGNCEYDENVIKDIESLAVKEKKKAGLEDEASLDSSDDEMLTRAIEVAVEAQQISATFLQRRLRVGYARAARLIDEMNQRGIVGPSEGSKPRKVLLTRETWLEMSALNGAPPDGDSESEESEV